MRTASLLTRRGKWCYPGGGDVITARKQSLGQGNIFTPVCHAVPGGGWYPIMHCRWYPSVPCSGSACSQGGCLLLGGGGLVRRLPEGDPPGRQLLRAVRILLECILVLVKI